MVPDFFRIIARPIKNGILRPDEGFDIIVNGADPSFRDRRQLALASALPQKRNLPDLIEARNSETGLRTRHA